MPPDKPTSSSILDTLQREYVIIGTKRVRSLHAWSAIALVLVGATLGISLVANRSGEFERTKAAGATIVAVSCNQTDVQAAIDQAQDGDVVQIPAGTCTWTTTVQIGRITSPYTAYPWTYDLKYITLQGAGVDQTVIIDNVNPEDATKVSTFFLSNALAVNTKPGGLTRVTGITFNDQGRVPDGYNKGVVSLAGNSTTWRIDHVRVIAASTAAINVYASGGVLDHNVIDLVGWHFGIQGFNGGLYGDPAWAEPSPAGTAIPYFIEDNVITGTIINTVAHDGWIGERVVFRHNTLKNAVFANHGTESGGRWRSARFSEVYENTFTFTIGDYFSGHPFSLRGGNGIFFNNVATGPLYPPYGITILGLFRDAFNYQPWAEADGHSPWDLNDPVIYATGTATAASASLPYTGLTITMTDATKSWATDQWVGYSIRNMTKGFGSKIVSNTATTISYDNNVAGAYGNYRLFDIGDTYEIKRVITSLDQAGRGQGDLIGSLSDGFTPVNTKTGTASWPNQVSEPSYAWNNTNNGVVMNFDTPSYHVIEGRDYFNSPMPGYTPYVYPHPLTLGGSLPPPPSDTTPPSVPSGLSASVVSSSQINLSWSASSDDVGVVGYKVYRNGTQVGSVSVTNFSNTGLSASTSYTYTVAAYDAAGNTSAQSSSVSATTQSVTPSTNKFIIGDRVQTTTKLNVRLNPGGGKPLGQQAKGAKGTVTLGPQTANNNTWYKIDYDTGVDGWSVQDYLIKI